MAREYGTGSERAREAEAVREVEDKRKAKKHRIIIGALCVAWLIIGGLVLLGGFQAQNALPARLEAEQAMLDEAMAEYNDVKAKYDINDGKTVVHVQPEMSSAAVAGMAVCESQNKLIKLNAEYEALRKEDPKAPKSDEHLAEIKEYSSWISGSTAGLKVDEPWTTIGYWFFGNTYEYRGHGTHRVVWECYSQNTKYSPLYAVATALYDPITATFADLHVYKMALYADDTAVPNPDKIDPGNGLAPAPPDQTNDPVANPPKETEAPVDENTNGGDE